MDYKFLFFFIYNFFIPLFTGLLFFIPMSISKFFNNNYIAASLKYIYLTSVGFYFRHFCNMEFYTNDNDTIKEMFSNKKQVLVIQNHISEIDSAFFYSLLDNVNKNEFNTVTLMKKAVAYQLFGLGMIDLFSDDVFLSRNIIRDSKNINNIDKKNDIVYLFPEGTVYTHYTKNRSDIYCKNQNLPVYDYVLYPRITGISMIIKKNKINTCYDLTCMCDTFPKSKFGTNFNVFHVFKYGLPKKVFINIKKYKLEHDDIEKKAEYIFKKKDEFIKNFKSFTGEYINYNIYQGVYSLTIMSMLSILSLYLYINYSVIRHLYLTELIVYLLYLYIYY